MALEVLLEQRDKADGVAALELEAATMVLTRLELSLRGLSLELLDEFLRRAGDHARFEPIARLHAVGERQVAGAAPAAEVADEVIAIMRAGPPADPFVFHAALDLLIRTERYEAAAPFIEAALETTRALGLPAQVAVLHTERALLGVGRGALADADLDVQLALKLFPGRLLPAPPYLRRRRWWSRSSGVSSNGRRSWRRVTRSASSESASSPIATW